MWDALFEEPEPSEEIREAWRAGLGLNVAAPEDVLLALVHLGASFLWRRDLPESVVDAALEQHLFGAWAERRDLTPNQWRRVIFGEHDPGRRARLLRAFPQFDLEPADWALLIHDPEPQVRAATLLHDIADEDVAVLAGDPNPKVRCQVCAVRWSSLDEGQRAVLLADSDETVRGAARRAELKETPLTWEMWDQAGGSEHLLRYRVLAPDLAVEVVSDPRTEVRRALAENPFLAPEPVVQLARDVDPDVRLRVACRPDLTDEQRDSIAIDVDDGGHYAEPDWVTALHDDPDAMRRLAASNVFLIRRAVARAKHLPPDVVECLANDRDRVVQLFLAESCDDAPADMLLRVAEWWTGSLSSPDVPRRHPNFPRRGLLRFADDPNPNLRRLALDDPESTADLVERFVDDPDENVRYRAESDPRISARTAERLINESGRYGLMTNPSLPPRLLLGLLRDERTACNAARNPALPVEVMREMVRRMA